MFVNRPRREARADEFDPEQAAYLADIAGLKETARAIRRMAAVGDGRDLALDTLNVEETLQAEASAVQDPLAADAMRRARRLLRAARAAGAGAEVGALMLDGFDAWSEAARHFEEALGALTGRTSAERRALAALRLVRLLWLLETVVKPAESRAFADLHRTAAASRPTAVPAALLRSVHGFAQIRRTYPMRLRGTTRTFACADTMLLRNAVAHALVEFRPDGGVVADLFDRERGKSVGSLRLKPRQLDAWFETLRLRVHFLVILCALDQAAAHMPPPAPRRPSGLRRA